MATTVKIAHETAEGYVKVEVKDGASALAAVLQMTMKHCADMLLVCVDVVSEHYKIDKDEMVGVIRAHPRFTGLFVDPVLQDLGYLEHPATAVTSVMPAVAEAREAAAAEEAPPPAAAGPQPSAPAGKKRGPKKLVDMTPEELAAHKAKVAARKQQKSAAASVASAKETEQVLAELDAVLTEAAAPPAPPPLPTPAEPVVVRCAECKKGVDSGYDHRRCFFDGKGGAGYENDAEWMAAAEAYTASLAAPKPAAAAAEPPPPPAPVKKVFKIKPKQAKPAEE